MGELYEQDFVRWSEEQASALRSAALSRTNLPLDWEHLAEEIDSLGKSLRSELRNRLATIIEHLLKLQVSPAAEPRTGSIETIERERLEIETLLEDNPGLRSSLPESIAAAERKGGRLARPSLKRHGEWTPIAERALAEAQLGANEVLGPWLPSANPGASA